MPHTRSAKKRMRQSETRRLRNRSAIKSIKTQVKRFLEATKTGDSAQIDAEFRVAVQKLDKAAGRRIVHPNLAARQKSRLARLIHAKATPKT